MLADILMAAQADCQGHSVSSTTIITFSWEDLILLLSALHVDVFIFVSLCSIARGNQFSSNFDFIPVTCLLSPYMFQ